MKPERAKLVADMLRADFVTADFRELLDRPEVTAVIVATDEDQHVAPALGAIERGFPMMIEKPLADNLDESARVLRAIEESGIDVVVGYTQRFRQRWLTAKDRISKGALGDVTLVTARGFLNQLIAHEILKRLTAGGKHRDGATPMVVTGTHMVDLVMWLLEGKTARTVQASSVNTLFGPLYGSVDSTAGIIEMEDGAICNICSSWALPVTWPCAVYSLEVGIVGTEGVLTVDDTHRDMVMAVSNPLREGYNPDSSRLVDFLGSYLPGDVALGELRGPMREETNTWLNRLSMGHATPHATAADGHNRLMLTKAFDLSAQTGRKISLPLTSDRLEAASPLAPAAA